MLSYCIFTGTRVKLVDGVNPSEGRIEIGHNNEWGTLCEHNFDESDARVICRMLGYDTLYVFLFVVYGFYIRILTRCY
jgi:hypothetical protein